MNEWNLKILCYVYKAKWPCLGSLLHSVKVHLAFITIEQQFKILLYYLEKVPKTIALIQKNPRDRT